MCEVSSFNVQRQWSYCVEMVQSFKVQIWPWPLNPKINRNPPWVMVNTYVKYHHWTDGRTVSHVETSILPQNSVDCILFEFQSNLYQFGQLFNLCKWQDKSKWTACVNNEAKCFFQYVLNTNNYRAWEFTSKETIWLDVTGSWPLKTRRLHSINGHFSTSRWCYLVTVAKQTTTLLNDIV